MRKWLGTAQRRGDQAVQDAKAEMRVFSHLPWESSVPEELSVLALLFLWDATWRINTASWWRLLLLRQWYPDLCHHLSQRKFIPEQWCCPPGSSQATTNTGKTYRLSIAGEQSWKRFRRWGSLKHLLSFQAQNEVTAISSCAVYVIKSQRKCEI